MSSIKARRNRAGCRSAFTLVELLVSTAITAVLAGLLIAITTGVMSTWSRSRGSLTTSNQVKFALDQLALDLEGAIMRNDGNVWLAATILETNNSTATSSNTNLVSIRGWSPMVGSGSVVVKPSSEGSDSDPRGFVLNSPSIADCRFGRAGVWMRFFSTKLDSNGDATSASAPSAISYQLRRRRISNNNSEIYYMLYRSVVRQTGASGTFEAGFDLDPTLPAGAGTYTQGSSTDGDPGNVLLPNPAQVLASNVIDFGVRLYAREENGTLRLIFPAKPAALGAAPAVGEPSDSSVTVPAAELSHLARFAMLVDPSDAYRNCMPDVVEVMLRVLTDEGAQLIQALEAGQLTGEWWTIAEAHSRVYVRRIEIVGKPL